MNITTASSVLLISDAHFGIDIDILENRVQYFSSFIKSLLPEISHIIIVGDFFNFWVEYTSALRSDYFSLLCILNNITDQGISVHYITGNHDFAFGSFLSNTIGLTIHRNDAIFKINGKKIYISHGDRIRQKIFSAKVLLPFLKNTILQKMYLSIHPDIGIALGNYFSRASRKHIRKKQIPDFVLNRYRLHALQLIQQDHYDIVIMAHTHVAEKYIFDKGVYCNTGSWLRNHNYALLKGGEITLYRHCDFDTFENIAAVYYP